jgi:galactokinase
VIDTVQLKEDFLERFGHEPRIFRAPARVNLIGEHTDYNDGFVMPFAIENAVYVAGALRDDDRIVVTSVDFSDSLDVSLSEVGQTAVPTSWIRYPFGVISLLNRSGHDLRGADLLIASDVPDGAGLSSSAALEVGIVTALKGLFDLNVGDVVEIAKIGQATENEFAGVNSGIMDQMASVLGRAGHALFLDCRSLEWQQVAIENASFLVCDTRTKHSLAESEYNTRRRECDAAAARMGKRSLRDAKLNEIASLPPLLAKRARHVITENERVLSTVEAFRSGDLLSVGELMNASHASLRDDFEVSCEELDIMSDICRSQPEILGSRMTGGGFGGCTISICRKGADSDSLPEQIRSQYMLETGIEPEIFISEPSDGASEI